jgi:hypothetical protein
MASTTDTEAPTHHTISQFYLARCMLMCKINKDPFVATLEILKTILAASKLKYNFFHDSFLSRTNTAI